MLIEAIIGIVLIYFIGKKLGFKIKNKKTDGKKSFDISNDEEEKRARYNAYMREYQRKRRKMKRQKMEA